MLSRFTVRPPLIMCAENWVPELLQNWEHAGKLSLAAV